MKLEWYESLAIGVDDIDNQHKELFNRFSKLLDACNSGCGNEEIGSLLLFLDEYVQKHFRDEEQLQISHSFPDYPVHREEHLHFISKFAELKTAMQSEGATLSIIISTNNMLIDWLVNHISKMDIKIGEHILSKKF